MQASRSGSEQSYASSIRISGWEPQRSELEHPRVDIDFSSVNMAGLTPPSQWQRMVADGQAQGSSSAATSSSSSPSALQLLMTREMARRQNLATPPSSRSSQQSLQHFAMTAAANASASQIPSSSTSQAVPFVPWHAFPPAHPQPTPLSVNCNMLTQQEQHLPSPPHTRDSSRSPSLIHMQQQQQQAAKRPSKNRQAAASAPSMSSGASTSSAPTSTTTTKFSRASAGKKHRTSTERKIERKRAENANYIPRPRNSFIIFRTDFVAKHKKEAEAAGVSTAAAVAKCMPDGDDDGDGDVRSLSKQASEVWNKMSEAEKMPWQERAEEEKRDHARKYPNYRYRPTRNNSMQGPQGPGTSSSLPVHEEEESSPAPEGEAPGTPTSPSKEEMQKRRCDLVFDLMRQGYRGAELTSALMVYEGNFMPPNVAESVPTAPPPPPVQPPVVLDSNRMRPPPLMSTPSHPLRFYPSSSSLSCALHMPIPRSPSAPLFNTRPAHDSSMPALPSSTPRSCPTTPQGRLDDSGSTSDVTSEQPSDTESPVTSASTINPPPESMPPSPEENRTNPLDAHSHFGLQNTHNIYSYDKPNDITHDSSIPAPRVAPYSFPSGFGVPLSNQMTTQQVSSQQPLTLPRPPLEMVAELWAQQAAPSAQAASDALAPDLMEPYLSLDYLEQPTLPSSERSTGPVPSQSTLLPVNDHVRFLSGLPSPPLSSTGSEQLRLFGADQEVAGSTGPSASSSLLPAAHNAAFELEAYHMALGQAYANEVGSSESGFGDYYFDLDLGIGGVLPESTISFSALGNSEVVSDVTNGAVAAAARRDLDIDMDYLTGAEYPYDHTTGHF